MYAVATTNPSSIPGLSSGPLFLRVMPTYLHHTGHNLVLAGTALILNTSVPLKGHASHTLVGKCGVGRTDKEPETLGALKVSLF